jgi:predicted nuclease of predicted toxin-antitoxin system
VEFFLDHDVPSRVGMVLRQAGHKVVFLRDVLSPTAADDEALEYARENGLILLTCNRDDFLALSRSLAHGGVVVLIRRRNRLMECAAILNLIERAGESGLQGNINFA